MQLKWLDAAEIVKITHVAEIVNIAHVARILEAEICGAKNVHAIPVYNLYFVADSLGCFQISFLKNIIPCLYLSESILANFLSGFFTATIFIPGMIILTNLLPGVFTADGITEPPPILLHLASFKKLDMLYFHICILFLCLHFSKVE